jgi:SNF2 family DNA or RNA helicase
VAQVKNKGQKMTFCIHGTWVSEDTKHFYNDGYFCVWIESSKKKPVTGIQHPYQLTHKEITESIATVTGFPLKGGKTHLLQLHAVLPSTKTEPLASSRFLRSPPDEDVLIWKQWEINAVKVDAVIEFLKNIQFMGVYLPSDFQIGDDLKFWCSYATVVSQILRKDQYIPSFKIEKGFPKKDTMHAGFEIVSPDYEQALLTFKKEMPLACTVMTPHKVAGNHYADPESVLRQFTECVITTTVWKTPITQQLEKKLANSMLDTCLTPNHSTPLTKDTMDFWKKWKYWQSKLIHSHHEIPFFLCFKLISATQNESDKWELSLLLASKTDPSLQIPLKTYWSDHAIQAHAKKQFGKNTDRDLLLSLGHASRLYSKLSEGLDTEHPSDIVLTMDEVYTFLKEDAWVLQDSGFKVIIPSWWSPKGQKRSKLRLKARPSASSGGQDSGGHFNMTALIDFSYDLCVDGEPLSEKEWQELVAAKAPFVFFRGEWIELKSDSMTQMLDFWKQNDHDQSMSLMDFVKKASENNPDIDIRPSQAISALLDPLHNKSHIKFLKTPDAFEGTLRDYQGRGFSWLHYLESLGLNPCLADDMGLGKTIQIIALLTNEKQVSGKTTTLLVAPTSVIGNWKKECEKFSPELVVEIHHGATRAQNVKDLEAITRNADVIVTSFALLRKDIKLFKDILWQRIVVDEAQNIKNPKSIQAKAMTSLQSKHRIALTGTPIENRLTDLWSIINFLNPDYLGTLSQFKKTYEIPIQRDNNRKQSILLKNLIEPLILRRLKTDKSIISELPDKIEQKVYCNLTKEQGSLYQAVVDEVEKSLDTSEGMARNGLMLSTLTKLKQICNHPAQFLQDESDFSKERSQKLDRILEMIEESHSNGESVLVFSQFTEICSALETCLKKAHYNTYFLHGGTPMKKRESMISEFQNPETRASIFILSLKAGGVGITLTKANQVFHFDRWWNPAVEDQASDRAYRIGQKKKVMIHKFVTIGTLEEKIDQLIEQKKRLSESVVGTGESWLADLDNDAFKKLIRLSKTSIMEAS